MSEHCSRFGKRYARCGVRGQPRAGLCSRVVLRAECYLEFRIEGGGGGVLFSSHLWMRCSLVEGHTTITVLTLTKGAREREREKRTFSMVCQNSRGPFGRCKNPCKQEGRFLFWEEEFSSNFPSIGAKKRTHTRGGPELEFGKKFPPAQNDPRKEKGGRGGSGTRG